MRLLAPLLFSLLLFPSGFASAKEAAPWDDPECEFAKVDLKLEPEALLKRFLEKDAAGQFLQSDRWMDKAVVCPGHLPGPDDFRVILSYEVVKKSTGKERATFKVRYQVAGLMGSGGREGELSAFVPKPSTQEFEFVAVKTPFGWKLEKFEWQLVLAGPALASARKWVAGDEEKFRAATGLK